MYIILLLNLKRKKNYPQVRMSFVKKNSSVFITHYIVCNLSTERQQARNLGQAVGYAASTQID